MKWPTGGGNTNLQSSPSNNQGGVHINRELRSIGTQNDSDYYNPNPWARILGRTDETDIEIDGIISKALIDSIAMLLRMSKIIAMNVGMKFNLWSIWFPYKVVGEQVLLTWDI